MKNKKTTGFSTACSMPWFLKLALIEILVNIVTWKMPFSEKL